MERTFYKIDIQGMVYLVDPMTSKAYTYDLLDPTEIGKILWTDIKQDPRIELLPSWAAILAAKLESTAQPPPAGTDAVTEISATLE